MIDSYHRQDPGSHGWQHHQALLQRRHLPDHHGGAGGHVQAHPYRNLTGDQRVSRTRARKSGGLHGGYGRHVNFFLFLSLMRGIRKAMRRCLGWFMVFCIIWNVVGQGVLGAAIPHAVWAEVFLMWFFFLFPKRDSSLHHAVALII